MGKKCPNGSKVKNGKCVKKKSSISKNSGSKGMKIFLGIALGLIFFSLFNLGVSTFYHSPEYSDYCDIGVNANQIEVGSDYYNQCNAEYDQAQANYSNSIFYIFVISGFVFAILGLFIVSLPFQIVLLGGGTALIIEGIARNIENKVPSFIAGVLLFAVLSYFVWRKFK